MTTETELDDGFERIYREQAAQYEQLVSREDYQEQIEPALRQIRPLEGLEVVELGAGTGRLTRMLARSAAHITAGDISPQMLSVARAGLMSCRYANWQLVVADNRCLPLTARSADLIVAGWSLGHSVGWYPDSWRTEIGRALNEMKRVLRSDGSIIILETLGTNQSTPRPPNAELADYYRWLETEHHFTRTWIRTDYQFTSVDEACDLTGFFFGREMAADVRRKGTSIVPECTGIWWLTLDT